MTLQNSVVGTVPCPIQAERIVSVLRADGFSEHQVSALFPDAINLGHDSDPNAPATASPFGKSTMSPLLLRTLGWLGGAGVLLVPDLGSLMSAGPLASVLGSAANRDAVDVISDALAQLGLLDDDAKRFESKLKDGSILLAVHADEAEDVKPAVGVFDHFGAEDVCVAETTAATSSLPALQAFALA